MILNSPRWDCRKSQVDGQLGGLDIIRKRERVAEAGVCHVYRGLSRASADRDGKKPTKVKGRISGRSGPSNGNRAGRIHLGGRRVKRQGQGEREGEEDRAVRWRSQFPTICGQGRFVVSLPECFEHDERRVVHRGEEEEVKNDWWDDVDRRE